MPKVRIAVAIVPTEYDTFLKLAPGDELFPSSYAAWETRTLSENAEFVAQGGKLTQIVVHPEELAGYCQAIGQPPSYYILQAVAVKKAAEQS